MGGSLFTEFPTLTKEADAILGYSIEELCNHDPQRRLGETRYTQPALYVVNALSHLRRLKQGVEPAFLAGHSLGEYDALFAAGALEFEAGLHLVARRGELMSQAPEGGMAAVLGLPANEVMRAIADAGLNDLDAANFNSPSQTVLSGPKDAIRRAETLFAETASACIVLNVSAPFHSRYMKGVAEVFRRDLENTSFGRLRIPVISNVTGEPHEDGAVREALALQVTSPVRWTDVVAQLLDAGVDQFFEAGPGSVLGSVIKVIRASRPPSVSPPPAEARGVDSTERSAPRLVGGPSATGSFTEDHGVAWPCLIGSMAHAISGVDMIARLARAGLLGAYGAAGRTLEQVDADLRLLANSLPRRAAWAVGLRPAADLEARVELCLHHGASTIEASGFETVPPSLVRFRLTDLCKESQGGPRTRRRLILKTARPDVAALFMEPPPQACVQRLLRRGLITAEAAALSASLPLASDIAAEGCGGGWTERASGPDLASVLVRMRAVGCATRRRVRIGLAGGIGTPESAAAAFASGLDFVVTGSINQCTLEAATSETTKDLLSKQGVRDVGWAPAFDAFESGGQVQVLTRGTLFCGWANRLHDLWRNFGAWNQVPSDVRVWIERRILVGPFVEAARETASAQEENGCAGDRELMAAVFRRRLGQALESARRSDSADPFDVQIWTGPAMGAANAWLAEIGLSDWRARHVDDINLRLMMEAEAGLRRRLAGGSSSEAAA